jgi:hypothetical protein
MSQMPVPATSTSPADEQHHPQPGVVVQRVCSPLLLLLAGLLMLFPVLHLQAVIRIWGTPDLPATWPLNLGLALLAGVGGFFIWGAGWRMLRRAYPFGDRGTRASTRQA